MIIIQCLHIVVTYKLKYIAYCKKTADLFDKMTKRKNKKKKKKKKNKKKKKKVYLRSKIKRISKYKI